MSLVWPTENSSPTADATDDMIGQLTTDAHNTEHFSWPIRANLSFLIQDELLTDLHF